MDKKEMLELLWKLIQECDKYCDCEDGCPFHGLIDCKMLEFNSDEIVQKAKQCGLANNLAEYFKPDNVNHPKHYETGKFECIDVMIETQGIEAVKSFCICNAFKYIYRHKNKNGCEDVKKAIWYLNKYVELDGGQ